MDNILCQNELTIRQNNSLSDSNKIASIIRNAPNVTTITILLLNAREKERLTRKAKNQKVYRKRNLKKEKARQLEYYSNNKGKFKKHNKKYRLNNKVKIKIRKREYNQKNRLKLNKAKQKRLAENIQARLNSNLRNRITRVMNGRAKIGSAVRDLGCSTNELKSYLESKFKKGMTWDNYGRHYTKDVYGNIKELESWHIDHIKPLSSFDLTDRKQFLQACHYTNLQPLWAEENMRKGSKIFT